MTASIDRDTKVRLGTTMSIIITLIVCTWRVSSIYGEMKSDVEKVMYDRYTLTAASEQAMRHAIANPGIRVPDPRAPGQFIQVDKARYVPITGGNP